MGRAERRRKARRVEQRASTRAAAATPHTAPEAPETITVRDLIELTPAGRRAMAHIRAQNVEVLMRRPLADRLLDSAPPG